MEYAIGVHTSPHSSWPYYPEIEYSTTAIVFDITVCTVKNKINLLD